MKAKQGQLLKLKKDVDRSLQILVQEQNDIQRKIEGNYNNVIIKNKKHRDNANEAPVTELMKR